MPIKENARKYMRVTKRKTLRNKTVKGVVKSTVKNTRTAITTGNATDMKDAYLKAQKAIDKAAAKGIIKKNTAARKKSRLNAAIKKASLKK
jgi:small subunit ribosomal protein S20